MEDTGFAYDYVSENLGSDEKNVEVIENTDRYSFLSRLKSLKEFGVRAMNGKAIIYPYWENVARGYEEILATLTLLQLLFFAYPVIIAVIALVIWWRHKNWTMKDVYHQIKDKAERKAETVRARRKKERDEFFIAEYEDEPAKQKRDKKNKKKRNKERKRREEDAL